MYQYADTDETRDDVLTGIRDDNESQLATLGRILEAASAMIDRYTDRPAAYFAAVGDEATATERRRRGEGKNYLRLGRHVPGSVLIEGYVVGTDFYEASNGWVYLKDPADVGNYSDDQRSYRSRIFVQDAVYLVSAVWGFAETPADIVFACKLIAAHIWDRGQGIFGQVSPSGFVIERDMPPTAATILDNWKRKEFEIN